MMLETFFSYPLSPEIFLLGMICLVLLVDLFVKQTEYQLTYRLSQIALLGTGCLVWHLWHTSPVILFNGSFVWDEIAALMKIAVVVMGLFIFVFARDYVHEREMSFGEYYVLSLLSILGIFVLISAYSLITLYLGLELISLPLYAMVALRRSQPESAEASMKYFIMGALASAMLLYGLSMLYGATHTLDVSAIASAISQASAAQELMLVFALVFIVSGIVFKLGGAPFHMWVPDVYEGAPTSVTLFISTIPKIAALGMMIRFLINAMPGLVFQWQEILTLVAVLSIAIGNLVAIVQSNLKRMLSYSAIAHIGYMLLGIVAATATGYASALFYMIVYSLMSLCAFGLLVLLSQSGIELENIEQLKGLNTRNPWLAFMMLLVMFSMAGIPPLVGFFAKLGVLEALISVHKVWLATYALVFAIIGAYYYLNVVKAMYFEEPQESSSIVNRTEITIAVTVNGLAILFLGLFPSVLINLCRTAFSLPF